MYCSECGKEIPGDSEFCAYCGAAAQAGAAVAAAQSPTPPAYTPPPPPAGGMAPPTGAGAAPAQFGPTPPRKSPLPWILGILGVLVVGAVVVILLLGFAVGPKWFAGDDKENGNGAAAESPEKVVETFFRSFEKQDAKMMLSTMEPDFVDELEDTLGEDYVDLLEEYFFSYFPEDLKINIKKMDKTIDGNRATVNILEGTMTYVDEYGDKVTEEASEADMDAFELVKVDGKWYLSEETLIGMGFDFSGLDDDSDFDLEDGFDDDVEGLVELPVDSEDEVLTIILEEDAVWDWYMETDLPQYDITDEDTSWVIYLYELDEDNNEIPFAWYAVDKETGEVFEVVE